MTPRPGPTSSPITSPVRWGVIADDFTGACDLAGQVAAAGASVVVVTRPEAVATAPDADWTVVAVKSRTVPVPEAVALTTTAARALIDHGATDIYQKYCSTFDSTDAGTIGQVADALLDLTGAATSVGTPATPAVGRTVFHGHLFVGDRLVSESPLRQHPLTPMHDPDLVRVLSRQTPRPVATLGRGTTTEVANQILSTTATHLILDAVDDLDLHMAAAALALVRQTGRQVLVGGGAGLASAIAARDTRAGEPPVASLGQAPSPRNAASRSDRVRPSHSGPPRDLLVIGSCSPRTREQLATFDGAVHHVDVEAIMGAPDDAVDLALAAVAAGGERSAVASSATPAVVARAQERWGTERVTAAVEDVLAKIAVGAVEQLGVRRLLVAGGETSGAVVSALGCTTLVVGPQVAPGLPWTTAPATEDRPPLTILLKSGNFGPTDLFTTAWETLP